MTRHLYGLISDTHGSLHPAVHELFRGAEAIMHAGDVVGEEILDELELLAPVHAVHGNCDDPGPRLPPERILQLPFGCAVITHSHLVATGRGHAERLVAHYAAHQPRLLLYGHTHQPYQRLHGQTWVINPGAAGRPRFRDPSSVMTLEWDSDTDRLLFERHPLDWSTLRRR